MSDSTIDVPTFYAALDQKRLGEGISWRGLAARLDITPSTFTRMVQGRRPRVDCC